MRELDGCLEAVAVAQSGDWRESNRFLHKTLSAAFGSNDAQADLRSAAAWQATATWTTALIFYGRHI